VAEAALAPGRFLADLWEALAPGRRVAVLWEAVAQAHVLAVSNTERAVRGRNVPLWVPRRRLLNIRWAILIKMVDHLSQYQPPYYSGPYPRSAPKTMPATPKAMPAAPIAMAAAPGATSAALTAAPPVRGSTVTLRRGGDWRNRKGSADR
jgi:hypothetical protein